MNRKKKQIKDAQSESFIENCHYLKLTRLPLEYETIIEQANRSNIGFFEFISRVIGHEADAARQRSIAYRIKTSKLPQPYKVLEDFDFSFQPTLKKKLIMDLATLNFLQTNESVLFLGNCGTGKSHLARSLALLGCHKGYKVYYTTCAAMLADLNTGVYEKTLFKRMRKYVNPQLLLIDEMGHDRLELEITREAHLLFKVIDERYKQNKPLLFTTNVVEQDWAEYLGDPISTQAILDRVFHRSIKVEINGPSYRQHEGNLLQQKYHQ